VSAEGTSSGVVAVGAAATAAAPAAAPDSTWFTSVLRGARADAGWAYRELWDAYAGRVRGYLRRQGAEDPDELTNEAFLSAFRSLDRFEGDEADFRSWLFSIVHRRLIDERRRRARRVRTVALESGPAPATDGGVLEAIDGDLSSSEVGRLVHELPPLQRDVLLLRVVAGLEAEEVGQLVDRRAGAVRMIQHRALAALRERLEAGA
jgi:RNA polymerase sigma factor (sigma-70 family)